LHIVVPPETEVHCVQVGDDGQSEHSGRTKASRPIRALKQKPKHSNTFRDPACRHFRKRGSSVVCKTLCLQAFASRLQVEGKSISLLMSQSFAVTVTLDIFFERR
jgi:hypothetical protein